MSHVHADLLGVAPTLVPGRLAALHRLHDTDDELIVRLRPGVESADAIVGAGFAAGAHGGNDARTRTITRLWSLPDSVGPTAEVLVCGLNPSPASADAGVGFARAGNRFWPAALAAGIVSRDRDVDHALSQHGLAMTDIVKRTTRRADELRVDEYRTGLVRLERLCALHQPRVVCFVGLAGWRICVDRRATTGPQAVSLGGVPVYVMPSTSGLNAHSRLEDLTEHLRNAATIGR